MCPPPSPADGDPSPHSHDFIGEFTTSYRELARGQSQFNVYEVRPRTGHGGDRPHPWVSWTQGAHAAPMGVLDPLLHPWVSWTWDVHTAPMGVMDLVLHPWVSQSFGCPRCAHEDHDSRGLYGPLGASAAPMGVVVPRILMLHPRVSSFPMLHPGVL